MARSLGQRLGRGDVNVEAYHRRQRAGHPVPSYAWVTSSVGRLYEDVRSRRPVPPRERESRATGASRRVRLPFARTLEQMALVQKLAPGLDQLKILPSRGARKYSSRLIKRQLTTKTVFGCLDPGLATTAC